MKKLYNLQINETIKKIIPPLSSEELRILENNIIRDGCREPICVWKNTIVDGHNRYSICTKHKIPFDIQEMEFNSFEEMEDWVCVNQLGRRNISEETRKYLIGKRYINEKIINKNPHGNNQFTKIISPDNSEKPPSTSMITASRLGREYKVSSRTIVEYAKYANSIDTLEQNEPELVSKVLSGDIKISQEDIRRLSIDKSPTKDKIRKHLENQQKYRKEPPAQKSIKDMPEYDPDAEISSITFTIPSWIGSMNRLISTDFTKTTPKAKSKLMDELNNLLFSIETIKIAIGESNNE